MPSAPVARSIAELKTQFDRICLRGSAFETLDPAVLGRRPSPHSWSVAECLAHLNLSVDPYFPVWDRQIAELRRQNNSAPDNYRLDFWGRILAWTLEPPPKFRFPAPPNFRPLIETSTEHVLPAFLDRRRRIIEALNTARGLAIDKIKIVSPFDKRVRYSVWSSFCVTAAHERRHLWQAERALETLSAKETGGHAASAWRR